MGEDNKNLPSKNFDVDPKDLKDSHLSLVPQLNVPEKIEELSKISKSIIKDIADTLLEKDIGKLEVVQNLLDIEELTLNSLYKQIIYHTHMIDVMMSQEASSGACDPHRFFQISELSTRTTNLMQQFIIFARSLPKHIAQMNAEFMDFPSIDFEDVEDSEYSETAAHRGDEELIKKLDAIQKNVKEQNSSILDMNLDEEYNADEIQNDIDELE